jgi:hypothetical protein
MLLVSFVDCGKKNDTARQPEKDKSNNKDFIKMSAEVTDQDSSSSHSNSDKSVTSDGIPKPGTPAPALVKLEDGDGFKISNWDDIKGIDLNTQKECRLEFEITRSNKTTENVIINFPSKGKKSIGFINDKELLAELGVVFHSNRISFYTTKMLASRILYNNIGGWYDNSVSAEVKKEGIYTKI